MNSYKKLIASGILSLTTAFGASAAEMPKGELPDTTQGIQSWYDHIRPLSYLRSPEEQCVPIHRLQDSVSKVFQNKASKIMDIMDRTVMTKKVANSFRSQEGALCFVDFQKEYGDSVTAAAMHFTDYNTIMLNLNSDDGCLVSAGIHEMQHSAQKYAGYPAPLKDLVIKDQDEYVMANEVDAHVIQAIGSWMLSSPSYSDQPYTGALNCLKKDADKTLPYLKEAAGKIEHIFTTNPNDIESGQTARELYEDFYNNKTINQRYKMPIRFLYMCMGNPNCFQQQHTLESLGIKMEGLGKIHYRKDYRSLPLHKPTTP